MAEVPRPSKEEEKRQRTSRTSSQLIGDLMALETNFNSPINLNIAKMTPLRLPDLVWCHQELVAKKVKLTNTGHTLILSAKWFQERPFITGGPLLGNYVFSQMHFHWGSNDMEGSEHTADGTQYPIEMHLVHFKSSYLTQESALREKDGVAVIVYFFKLQSQNNPALQTLLNFVKDVQKAHVSVRMENLALNFLIRPFVSDYFMYWGSIATSTCSHIILWLICREPIGISAKQIDVFRTMLDENDEPLLKNFRNVQTPPNKNVYHISPSTAKYSTLLPVPRETAEPKQQKRSSKNSHNTTQTAQNITNNQLSSQIPISKLRDPQASKLKVGDTVSRTSQERVRCKKPSTKQKYENKLKETSVTL